MILSNYGKTQLKRILKKIALYNYYNSSVHEFMLLSFVFSHAQFWYGACLEKYLRYKLDRWMKSLRDVMHKKDYSSFHFFYPFWLLLALFLSKSKSQTAFLILTWSLIRWKISFRSCAEHKFNNPLLDSFKVLSFVSSLLLLLHVWPDNNSYSFRDISSKLHWLKHGE
jgi:hypothetical protein